MNNTRVSPWPIIAIAALFLSACGSHVQTSSGAAYLDRYESVRNVNYEDTVSTVAVDDQAVREIANVEPDLRFPARIGIARVVNSRLAPIPANEAQQWKDLSNRLGPDWGEFVPISPLVAALVSGSAPKSAASKDNWGRGIHETIRAIRFGAARQHVDAVLIYEVFADSDVATNVLSVTKVAIIGYWLAPSEEITANGFANAMLVDVRNGYVYGYAESGTEKPVETLSTSVNEDANVRYAMAKAQSGAVGRLVLDVEKMARDLRLRLAEKRANDAEKKG